MCTAIVSSRGIFPVDGSARGEDFYLATRGDFSLATREDLEVATREDFFMAMDRSSLAPSPSGWAPGTRTRSPTCGTRRPTRSSTAWRHIASGSPNQDTSARSTIESRKTDGSPVGRHRPRFHRRDDRRVHRPTRVPERRLGPAVLPSGRLERWCAPPGSASSRDARTTFPR